MDVDDLNIIQAGGSPVIEIEIGQSYALADRPGLCTVVQFESSDEVVVREFGTRILLTVPITNLRSLTEPTGNTRGDLALEDEERISEAEAKLKAIKDLLPFRRIPKEMWESQSEKTGHPVKTLREWFRRYRKDKRLSSLMRKRRKDAGMSRLHPLVEGMVTARINALKKDGNLLPYAAYEDLEEDISELKTRFPNDQQIKTPVFSTFYERYRALPEYDKDAAKLGKRQAGLLHNLHKGSIQDVNHPLSLIQVDHLELPVMVVDEEDRIPIGKGWITVLIDVWSRCVMGYYITLEAPGDLSLGMAMCHAILPKDETLKRLDYEASWPVSGFMWSVLSDNAGEFHGNMLELAAMEYGIELRFRKVKQPQYGAHIESYLGKLSKKLRRIPGATREGKDALGDYDPSENAIMTLAELETYILNLMVEYHVGPHSALNDMPPMTMFKEGLKGGHGATPIGRIRRASDPVKLRLDFLPVEERVINEKGIVIDYIWYMDDCLQRWVNARDPKNTDEARKFLFRRDPRDITRIYFWDPEDRVYKRIRTRNVTRPSMSLWEFTAIRKFLEQQGIKNIDEDLIFKSRAARRKLLSEAAALTRKKRLARERERIKKAESGAKTFQNEVSAPPAGRTSNEDTAPGAAETSTGMPPVDSVAATPYMMNWDD